MLDVVDGDIAIPTCPDTSQGCVRFDVERLSDPVFKHEPIGIAGMLRNLTPTIAIHRPLSIGFLADSFLPIVGGAETVLNNLATRLANQGDKVLVVTPHVRGVDNRLDVPYGVKRYSRPSSKRFGVSQVLLPLAWHAWRNQFDVLHCNSSYPAAYLGTTLKAWTNLPVVVRPHGDDILPRQRICRHPRLAAQVKQTLSRATAVIAQGQFLRRTILDMGIPDRNVHVIHNGVDLAQFSRGERYAYHRPYILALGSLYLRKGFDVLLRAFAQANLPDVDLLIAGTGPELKSLNAIAAQLGIARQVRFLGHVAGQEKIDLLRSALFLTVPSRCEPFANVILEGLASGLPVVASHVDGNTELVTHNRNGLLFPTEDVEALSDALKKLVDSPTVLQRLKSGVPASVQRFDWFRIAQQYYSLYQHVAGRSMPATAESRYGLTG